MTQPLQEEASAQCLDQNSASCGGPILLELDFVRSRVREKPTSPLLDWNALCGRPVGQIASGYLRSCIDNILTFLSIAAVSALYGDRTFFVRPREDHE